MAKTCNPKKHIGLPICKVHQLRKKTIKGAIRFNQYLIHVFVLVVNAHEHWVFSYSLSWCQFYDYPDADQVDWDTCDDWQDQNLGWAAWLPSFLQSSEDCPHFCDES